MSRQQRAIQNEGLLRMAPFVVQREDGSEADSSDGLTLEGHAATFDSPTVINSWEGRFTEQIAPGAFRKTFRERTPVLQFDHGSHPLIGSVPLGRFIDGTPKEDDSGAFVRARLMDNWLVQPIRDAIAEETVSGMSFRFSVVRDEWRDADGKLVRDDEVLLRMLWDDSDFPVRTLREVKVSELGPVVFPAYEGTDVGVRSGSTTIDLAKMLSSKGGQKTLARALFVAERATLGHSDPVDAPPAEEQAPVEEEQQQDTPQAEPAPVPNDTDPEPADRTATLAAQMRDRLASLNRSN